MESCVARQTGWKADSSDCRAAHAHDCRHACLPTAHCPPACLPSRLPALPPACLPQGTSRAQQMCGRCCVLRGRASWLGCGCCSAEWCPWTAETPPPTRCGSWRSRCAEQGSGRGLGYASQLHRSVKVATQPASPPPPTPPPTHPPTCRLPLACLPLLACLQGKHVVSPSWLWCCAYTWGRADEAGFPVKPGGASAAVAAALKSEADDLAQALAAAGGGGGRAPAVAAATAVEAGAAAGSTGSEADVPVEQQQQQHQAAVSEVAEDSATAGQPNGQQPAP